MYNREFDDDFREDVNSLVERYEKMMRENSTRFFEESSLEQIIEYYEENNQYDRAIEVTNIAITQHPFSASLIAKKAQLLFDLKQFQEALDLLDKAIILDPADINIYLLKADIYLWLNDFKKAIAIIDDCLQLASKEEQPDLYLELADIYEECEKYEKVFECLKHTLELDPDNEEALNRIWFCVEVTEKYEESAALHNQLIDHNPYSYLAWFNLGHAYTGLGLYEKAVEAFELAIAIEDKFEFAYKDCAEVYFHLKEYQKAADYFIKAALVSKPYKELYFSAGECYEKLKDYNKARFYYRKATTLDPYYDNAFYKIGVTYQAEGKWENARQAYERANKLNPHDVIYIASLGKAYLQNNLPEKAVAVLSPLLDKKCMKREVWLDAACAMFHAKMLREAFHTLDHAISLFENNAEFYYIKSAYYYLAGNKKEALLNLETALLKKWKLHKIIFNIAPEMEYDAASLNLIDLYKK
jgi:tetratricopeptide (TPR) repeat protein